MEPVKGYKVFNPDWTCRGKQYTCPGKFEEDVELSVCSRGMHFCKKAADCFDYYSFDPENKVAEVVAYGEIVEEGDKCVTNKLEIVRKIPWTELLELVNTGKGCTGNWNSGDHNSGNRNSGNWNSGDWNSGDWNSGNWNSGDWNSGDYSSGCFNTTNPKIFLFNQPSEWTYRDWINSQARDIMCRIELNVKWIQKGDMTEEEKTAHPDYEVTGGYLKKVDNKEVCQTWWDNLTENERNIIKSIPNFDADIFKEITGIEV